MIIGKLKIQASNYLTCVIYRPQYVIMSSYAEEGLHLPVS